MGYVRGRCRIKILLKRMDKSQRWLSEQLGKPEQIVSDWANNRMPISNIEVAKNIAHYLKCSSIDDLYEWTWSD